MARRPRITQASVAKLGVERLSELLVSESATNKALKQVLQLALESDQGVDSLAASIRQRMMTIERAQSRLSTNKGREMIAEVRRLQASIINDVGKADPTEGLDLLWQLIDLHRGLIRRTRDRAGRLSEYFASVVPELPTMAARSTVDVEHLAEQVFERFVSDVYGIYRDLIKAFAEPLKAEGLAKLRIKLVSARDDARKRQGRSGHLLSIIDRGLRDVADCMGDVDGFIETFSAKQTRHPALAAEMSQRLVAADRAQEALVILDHAEPDADDERVTHLAWMNARLAALKKTGNTEEVKRLSWQTFEAYLSTDHLREYLKLLPDFDDVEAEEHALEWVSKHPNFHAGLIFLVEWPSLSRAAQMISARQTEINGDLYELLHAAAEKLDGRYPLAGILLRRAVISFTLSRARKHRYKQMVRYTNELQSLDAAVTDYAGQESHKEFLERLWLDYPHTSGFWTHLA